MENLYLVIVLHVENQQAFTAELNTLFPFGTMDFVSYNDDTLLFMTIDIEEICWTNFDVSVLFLDQNIALFSHKHPYLRIGVINKIGQHQNCFYDSYIIKNKQIIFEHAELNRGYVVVLKQLLESKEEIQEAVFLPFFQRNEENE